MTYLIVQQIRKKKVRAELPNRGNDFFGPGNLEFAALNCSRRFLV